MADNKSRPGACKSFLEKFEGPFRVIEIYNGIDYKLSAEGRNDQVVHYNRLRKFESRPQHLKKPVPSEHQRQANIVNEEQPNSVATVQSCMPMTQRPVYMRYRYSIQSAPPCEPAQPIETANNPTEYVMEAGINESEAQTTAAPPVASENISQFDINDFFRQIQRFDWQTNVPLAIADFEFNATYAQAIENDTLQIESEAVAENLLDQAQKLGNDLSEVEDGKIQCVYCHKRYKPRGMNIHLNACEAFEMAKQSMGQQPN